MMRGLVSFYRIKGTFVTHPGYVETDVTGHKKNKSKEEESINRVRRKGGWTLGSLNRVFCIHLTYMQTRNKPASRLTRGGIVQVFH